MANPIQEMALRVAAMMAALRPSVSAMPNYADDDDDEEGEGKGGKDGKGANGGDDAGAGNGASSSSSSSSSSAMYSTFFRRVDFTRVSMERFCGSSNDRYANPHLLTNRTSPAHVYTTTSECTHVHRAYWDKRELERSPATVVPSAVVSAAWHLARDGFPTDQVKVVWTHACADGEGFPPSVSAWHPIVIPGATWIANREIPLPPHHGEKDEA
jgi:hypothetical protein